MKRKPAIIVNLFVGILSYAAWLWMVLSVSNGGPLTAGGLFSLKFFTNLSNLFNGAVCLVYAFRLLGSGWVSRRLKTWKLAGTAAAGLTFTTVMGFLGPVFGYQFMFNGPNFFLHLLLPVVSMLSFVLLERNTRIPFRNTLWAMVPVALYAVGYLTNVLVQGVGDWPDRHDFYGFLMWGWPVGLGIAAGLMLVTWLLAILLRALGGGRRV